MAVSKDVPTSELLSVRLEGVHGTRANLKGGFSMPFKTIKNDFWSGKFGDDYICTSTKLVRYPDVAVS